mmetsp:Transcript_43001/g.100163  ORF Transcript_43001/g.100163 Transcript_43001/m.100163 type:complete len:627 (-) Transcript_43001:107-1987(-)
MDETFSANSAEDEALDSSEMFHVLLRELEAVHTTEIRKLREQLATHRTLAEQPYPRMSPPVSPIIRQDSRPPADVEDIVDSAKSPSALQHSVEGPVPDEGRRQRTSRTSRTSRGSKDGVNSPGECPSPNAKHGNRLRYGLSFSSLASSLRSLHIGSPRSQRPDENDKDAVMMLEESEELDARVRQHDDAIYRRFQNVFIGSNFEIFIATMLLFNILLMAAQLQYHGFNIGYTIQYPRYLMPADEYWPHVEAFFLVGDIFFAVLFTTEMLIRMSYFRCAFFKHWLNWMDFLVVISSWTELFAAGLPISPTFLRMLRLGKLLRALRVVKMSQVLESLQLLLKCIAASMRILFWSLVLLLIIQCSAGMTISYMLTEFMIDESVDQLKKFEVFRYYGTFSKTLLTMFEVLFANWAPACRVLIDNVSEWYASVFIIYRCFVGFAVLNVVNAVFVQSTMKVAQADEEFLQSEKMKAQETYRRRLTNLFKQVDSSGDGKIDIEEFSHLLESPRLQIWLQQLEIETNDLVGLFKMLDDGDGEISLEEFEAGIMKIKGVARSFDLNKTNWLIQKVITKLDTALPASSPNKARRISITDRSITDSRPIGQFPSIRSVSPPSPGAIQRTGPKMPTQA